MASIIEKVKGSKIISFKFRTCLGRDENGKQILKCTTWYPEEGLTKAKSRKAAAAAEWEKAAREAYLLEKAEKEKQALEAMEKAEVLTFDRFVREVWLPLAVNDGQHRPSTVAMYTHILALIPLFINSGDLGIGAGQNTEKRYSLSEVQAMRKVFHHERELRHPLLQQDRRR